MGLKSKVLRLLIKGGAIFMTLGYTMFIQKKDVIYMITRIQKWGNSQGIRLPKYILELNQWKENDQIDIKAENGNIIISKVEESKRKNIKELFADYDGQYSSAEIDWGKPAGKEIW